MVPKVHEAAADTETVSKFGRIEDALAVVPRMRSAFGEEGATFDQLFDVQFAHRATSGLSPDLLHQTPSERAAFDYLYPEVLRLFENKHGRIEEQYWCTQLAAGAVRTGGHEPEFSAIVDWDQQDDSSFVEQMFALDELNLGNRYLPMREDRLTLRSLIFDAYSSALDALEKRRAQRSTDQNSQSPSIKDQANLPAKPTDQKSTVQAAKDGANLAKPTDQPSELELVKDQVSLAQRFYKGVAQRRAQTETLRGMALGASILLSLIAVAVAWVSATGLGPPLSSLLTWALAGTVGAFLSVLIRIAREDFAPNWEASDDELRVTGALRAFVGAALGVAIPVLVIAGLQGVNVRLPSEDLKSWYESPWEWWRLQQLEKMEPCQTPRAPSGGTHRSFVSERSAWSSRPSHSERSVTAP